MSSPAEITIQQQINTMKDSSKASGLEVDRLGGPLTVNLMPSFSKEGTKPVLVPPAVPRPFVNRGLELEQLVAALEMRRRVLLYGMPGIGKTALALAAANSLHDKKAFKDGILWVSEVRNAPIETICEAIARLLGNNVVAHLPPDAKPDATREALARFPDILMILDYVDSSDTVQTVVDLVLPDDVALLITSRIHHVSMDIDIPVDSLELTSAIKLFRETAISVQGDDSLISEICTLLDCHPLALVIAARRIHVEHITLLSLNKKLEKTNRLASLKVGDGKDKNRSVWVSLDLSYAGLSAEQRQVLTHLAGCFATTTGLELLAQACDLSMDECDDYLGGLVGRSLVERSGDRLRLQPLVRDFGRDILGDQLLAVQNRVAAAARDYVSRYMRKAPPSDALASEEAKRIALQWETDKLNALESEAGNLVGAVRHAAAHEDWETTLAMAKALGLPVSGMLGIRGYWTEFLEVGRLGIQAADETGDAWAAARFRHNAATILESRGEYAEARQLYEENVKAFTEMNDQRALAATWHNLGVLARKEGDYTAARVHLKQSRDIKERPEYEKYLATTLYELGQLAEHQSDYAVARALYEESRRLDEKYQNSVGVALNRQQLGVIRQLLGDPDEARRLYLESQAVYEQLADKSDLASIQHRLGRLSYEQGEYDKALVLLQQSLHAGEALGAQVHVGEIWYELGVLAHERGQRVEARACYERSLKICKSLHIVETTAYCQLRLGMLAREEANQEEASRLYMEAKSVFERLGDRIGLTDSLQELGYLALAQNRLEEARELLEQSLRIGTEVRYKLGVARSLDALGQLAQAEGHLSEARSLYQQSAQVFKELASPHADAVYRSLERLS